MSALWVAIVAVALASAAIKAAGPVLVGGRELPPQANAVIALLASALLAALVVTETFGENGHFALDERALGVGVAAAALALRAPVLVAVALAALVTIFSKTYERYGHVLHRSGAFLLEGRVEVDRRRGHSFLVERIEDLAEVIYGGAGRVPEPRAVSSSGAFVRAGRSLRRGRSAG